MPVFLHPAPVEPAMPFIDMTTAAAAAAATPAAAAATPAATQRTGLQRRSRSKSPLS
ncbi:hypothetical protein PY310_16880 [Pseudarthrobacter sp. H3Y2-7]|nr:hypothetical protein [Pseudarthrobacter sp. H3Y2-7]